MYKRLRREGYSESEALDDSQITKDCCRATIATQTDVSQRVYAAGRPVTESSGRRVVEDISRFPRLERFGVLADTPGQKVILPQREGFIEYQEFEGNNMTLDETLMTIMGVRVEQVYKAAETRREAAKSRGSLMSPASSTSGEDDPRLRRAGLGTVSQAASVRRIPKTISAVQSKVVPLSTAGIKLGSSLWSKIKWNIGTSYDIKIAGEEAAEAFQAPLVPETRKLSISMELANAITVVVVITTNAPMTPLQVINEINEFVNKPLKLAQVNELLTGYKIVDTQPEMIWGLRVSQHEKEAEISVLELRAWIGLSMKFASFAKDQGGDSDWSLLVAPDPSVEPTDLLGFDDFPEDFTTIATAVSNENEETGGTNLILMLKNPQGKAGQRRELEIYNAKRIGNSVGTDFANVKDLKISAAFFSFRDVQAIFDVVGLPIVFILSDSTVIITTDKVKLDGNEYTHPNTK